MLQNCVSLFELVLNLILDQIVRRAGVEVRVLTQGDPELGQTFAASISWIT